MGSRDLSLTSLLTLSKEVLNVYKAGDKKPKVVSETEDQIMVVKSLLEQLEKQKTVETPPDMLKAMSDIMSDLDRYLKRITDFKERKGQETARWLRFVPVFKPVVQSLGPAFALYMAMMPTGTWTMLVVLGFIGLILFLRVNPRLATDLADAWNDKDNSRFARMQASLEHHATQLRRYIALQEQMRASRRYDVSKTLTDESARKFWITHFGAENHSVDTSRFIETLLFMASGDDENRVEYKDDHRRLIYSTIEQIVDNNKDGSVSPYEFSVFLKFFGPLEKCCEKVVNSLVNLKSNPPSLHAWFCWRSMDRKDVNENLTKEDGIFVIRTSSQPDGKFAISYVSNTTIHHSKIVNDLVHGYHFEATPGQKDIRYFPDLHALVVQYSHILKNPYRDPNIPVKFNFFRYPNTLLGEMFSGDERQEGKEVFFDRDPAAFGVILNWYRYHKLMIPSNVPLQLVKDELKFFRVPADLSEADLGPLHDLPRALERSLSDRSLAAGDSKAPLDRTQTRNSPPASPKGLPSPPNVDSGKPSPVPTKPDASNYVNIQDIKMPPAAAAAAAATAPAAAATSAAAAKPKPDDAYATVKDFSYASGTGAGATGTNAPSVPSPLQRTGTYDPTGSRKRTVANLVAKASATTAPTAGAPAASAATPGVADGDNYRPFTAGVMDEPAAASIVKPKPASVPPPAPTASVTPSVENYFGASSKDMISDSKSSPAAAAVDPKAYKQLGSANFYENTPAVVAAATAAPAPAASGVVANAEIYGVLPADSMAADGAATAAAAAPAEPPLDIDVESKPYWWGPAGRDVCAVNLKAGAEYLFRICGDPGERIDGKPNPNLFVLSYMEGAEIKNMKIWRFPGEGVGQDRTRNCTIHRTIEALTRAIMGERATGIANPNQSK